MVECFDITQDDLVLDPKLRKWWIFTPNLAIYARKKENKAKELLDFIDSYLLEVSYQQRRIHFNKSFWW